MKKFLFFASLIMFVSKSASPQNVKYHINKDDAGGDNLWIVADPIYTDLYAADINAGWAGEVNLRVKKIFSITAIYRQPYTGKESKSDILPYNNWRYLKNDANQEDLFTTNRLKMFHYFEGNIAFHLSDRAKNGPVAITLHQSTHTNYWAGTKTTYTESINVPGTTRNTVALRAGYIMSRTPLNVKSAKITFKDAKGQDFQMPEHSFTMMDYYSVYGGFSTTENRNLKISAEGYGDKGDHSYSSFYADFIYAPYIHLDDFEMDVAKFTSVNGTPSLQSYVADSEGGFVKKNMGWRIGGFYRNGFLDMTLECGARPGVKTKRGYFLITFGIAIPASIKPLRPVS